MKNIDIKSLIIGVLLTSTVILGVAAVPSGTGTTKVPFEWDDKQRWEVDYHETTSVLTVGMEPFAVDDNDIGSARVYYRKRIK